MPSLDLRSSRSAFLAALALAAATAAPSRASELQAFTTRGIPGSEGVVVQLHRPAHWKQVATDDEMALAELRGTQGRLTAILQIGRGRPQQDMESLCRPERARTMLQGLTAQDPDTRVTDVSARTHEGRRAYDLRYERNAAPEFLLVRSVIVCLKDSRLVVSCGAVASMKMALAEIEPVCRQVLDSLSISEEPAAPAR